MLTGAPMTSSVVLRPVVDVPTVLQSPVSPDLSPDRDKPDTPPSSGAELSHVAVQADDDGDMCVGIHVLFLFNLIEFYLLAIVINES